MLRTIGVDRVEQLFEDVPAGRPLPDTGPAAAR